MFSSIIGTSLTISSFLICSAVSVDAEVGSESEDYMEKQGSDGCPVSK